MTGTNPEWWALTPRELDILKATAEGLTNPETARKLYLGTQTIKFHRTNLFRKIGAVNAPHAVALAYQTGILSVDPGAPDPEWHHLVSVDGVAYERSPAA